MQRFLLFTLLICQLFSFNLQSQEISEDEIRNSNLYYFGVGKSPDENQARDRAIAELSEQISVTENTT